MADNFVEITRQGWGTRMKNAFGGIVFGIVLTIGAFPLLFLNEGRAVKRHQTLQEGAGVVVSVAADRIDPAQEGRLVHVTGTAEAKGELKDPQFGVSVSGGLKLRRSVEIYQWVEEQRSETRNKVGGGTETVTTFTYSKKWAPTLQSSSGFREPAGHQNPESIPFPPLEQVANPITLGAFTLPDFFVAQLNDFTALAEVSTDGVAEDIRAGVKAGGGGFYVGVDPAAPAVGDVRVTFAAVQPGLISVVAQQAGETFARFRATAGGEIAEIQSGTHSAEEMFAAAVQANKALTWILRGAGLLMMTIGLTLIAQPLKVMSDVLPLAGRVVGMGIGLFAFIMAGIGSTVTVAVAWIFYRPVIGISVLVVTALLMVWLGMRLKKAKPQTAPDLAGAAPPPLG
jgi:hypothetical protein